MFAFTGYSQEKMKIEGAIVLGDSEDTTPEAGTLRWSGTDFEGWNGLRWVSLTGFAKIGSVTDIEGNIYNTSQIGDQEWMVENLKVSRLNNNSPIDQITDPTEWQSLFTPAWCLYDNDTTNESPFGHMYNWFAVSTGHLCPEGWHIPTTQEWTILIDFLGGQELAGGKMKEQGTVHWNSPNIGATNQSGFTGLPSGSRQNGVFLGLRILGIWWASNEFNSSIAIMILLNQMNDDTLELSIPKTDGNAVRCIKD